jgi:predicted glycosyltransferase
MTGRRAQSDGTSPAREPSARIAIYSHDTYGLGHLMRSTRLARAALQAIPQSSVLMLSGSPVAHRFRFPAGLDYVKLPSVVKSGPDTYDARDLRISRRRVRDMRSQLILDAIGFFRPHLFMVDNVPLGMKGELMPALSWLKAHRPTCRIHLNLRDILDDPQTIRAAWQALDVPRTLREVYHAIHIFGDPRIFDAIGAYDLPVDRSDYLHYIAPASEERAMLTPLPASDPGRWRVLGSSSGPVTM